MTTNKTRHEYLAKYAKGSAILYNYIAIMPRWLLLLLTGTIASTVISFLHSGEEEKAEAAAVAAGGKKNEGDDEVPEWAKEAEAVGGSATTEKSKGGKASAPATPSKGSVKKRKGGKK